MFLTREIEASGVGPNRYPLPVVLRGRSEAGIVAAASALGDGDRLCASAAYAGAHLARALEPVRAPALAVVGDFLATATGVALGTQLSRGTEVTLALVPAPQIASARAVECLEVAVSRSLPLIVLADEEGDEEGAVEAALPAAAGVGIDVEVLGGPEPETAYAACADAVAGARAGGPKLILMPAASVVETGTGWGSAARPNDAVAAYARRLMEHGYPRERLRELRRQAESEARFG
jgi:hypothetical protein